MPPNIAFASSPAILLNDTLTVSGPSQPVFVGTGEGVAPDQGTLVARSVAVQQDGKVFGGPASLGDAKDWTAQLAAAGCETGEASATGVEVYAFGGAQAPLLATFTWSQDITIDPG